MINYSSGKFTNHKFHSSFLPSEINHNELKIEDSALMLLIGNARAALASLNTFSKHIPDIDMFISMHTIKEASKSSEIEGTQTSITEVIQPIDALADERKDDWQEVTNYISAMNEAQVTLKDLPLSTRVIKQLHKTLMSGVRGKYKGPGEFRRSQNWIGGSSISDATFVPPNQDALPELLSDLEKFINNDEIALDPLVKIAIIHYQFETIHPFQDGNGRVGRLMIPLFLQSKELLSKPILYMSQFFEQHRAIYYDKLMAVRLNSDLVSWIKFFLNGIVNTADKGVDTLTAILDLVKRDNEKVAANAKYDKYKLLLNKLYSTGIITEEDAKKILGVSKSTAYRYLNELKGLKIIVKTKNTDGYVHAEYLSLLDDKLKATLSSLSEA